MKIKHLLIGMLAVAAAVACKQDEPVETPKLDVDKEAVAVAAVAGEASFNVTSNQSWVASADQDWVSVNPASGDASEKAVAVKVTAEDNETTEARIATVTVKAGELTKTVKVTQAPGENTDTPTPPEPSGETYILVGEAVGGWSVDENGVVLTLEDGYYVAKEVPVTAKKGMHFTKNNKWEGNVKGLHGLIAPNEIGEVGNNDISLTEGGAYDVYLTEALDKFYFMSIGKLPSEAVEHVEIAVTWGVCGAIDGNQWGSGADVELTADGEWLSAKGIAFTEVNFKVRGNNSWADDVKWGAAASDQTCELNKAIAVSTCTEFKAANPEAGDNPNVYIPAGAGTYDVYFSPDKKEVWVMQPGLKPGETPEPEPEYELDGKQWLLSASGMYVLVDLGLYEEDAMVIAIPLMDGSGFGAYMYGTYEIEKANNTSGKIVFTQYDPEWDEWMEPVDYAYSDLSDELVMINAEPITGYPDALPFVAVAEPYEIIFESAGGDPVGPIENGQYWFFNGTKVMAPLAEGETTGTFPAGNVIDGASTEKNIFTLMYDPDMSYYTIMDSYGRYVGHTDWESGNLTVTDVLPTGDDYAYYLWCVDNSYADGTCDIYNAATCFGFAYSATENCWYADENSYDTDGIRPTLVLAENPVEEPVEPAGPKVVTVAEFLAAFDNTIEYQVSGTITGIYQAYNASYGNISIYIADETGEMLAYRLSCAGIDDPANTITKGDLITVKGMRTLYNETPQMAQGCVIVEHTDVIIEAPAGSATLSFADKANRTTFTTSQQVWEQNGVKLINDKGSSTSNVADYAAPARFYKSSKITVEYAGMTKIEFTCNNGSYATALKSSITTGTVSVNGSVVTVVLPAAADSYVISSLTGGQVRMDSLTVYTE